MRAIDTEYLQEGQKLAKPIYDDFGRILLHKGTIVKKNYIRRLEDLKIPFVYIEDDLVGPLDTQDIIHDSVRIQSVKMIKDTMERAKVTKEVDVKAVNDIVNKILDDITSAGNLLITFLDIRSKNLLLFNHCISVTVLTIVTGMILKFDQLKLKQLGMGAILHDIGKSLTEGEEHTTAGFNLIRANKEVNLVCAHIAYQHHERYDGKGFPRGLKKEEIHLFGAITAIANYYDNLVAPENMKERLYPYQAIEKVVAQSGKMFHPELVIAFTRNIAPYPIGSLVRINSGSMGVVVKLHANYPTRPIIKLVTDRFGKLLSSFPEIDLLQENTVFINEIISEKERQKLGI